MGIILKSANGDVTLAPEDGTGSVGVVIPRGNIASMAYSDGNSIGVGQTWVDEAANRTYGVTYTNSTGKPIEVSVASIVIGTSASATAVVDGMSISNVGNNAGTTQINVGFSFIVPNNSTYSVGIYQSVTLIFWKELK